MVSRRWRRLSIVAVVVVGLGILGWMTAGALGFIEARRGDGWRLLAITQVDPDPNPDLLPHGSAAGTKDAIEALWLRSGATGPLVLDVDREALLQVTRIGSGCPRFLTAVELAVDAVRIRTSEGLTPGCSAAGVPYTFLIAVRRDRLPDVPFRVFVEGLSFEISTFAKITRIRLNYLGRVKVDQSANDPQSRRRPISRSTRSTCGRTCARRSSQRSCASPR